MARRNNKTKSSVAKKSAHASEGHSNPYLFLMIVVFFVTIFMICQYWVYEKFTNPPLRLPVVSGSTSKPQQRPPTERPLVVSVPPGTLPPPPPQDATKPPGTLPPPPPPRGTPPS